MNDEKNETRSLVQQQLRVIRLVAGSGDYENPEVETISDPQERKALEDALKLMGDVAVAISTSTPITRAAVFTAMLASLEMVICSFGSGAGHAANVANLVLSLHVVGHVTDHDMKDTNPLDNFVPDRIH